MPSTTRRCWLIVIGRTNGAWRWKREEGEGGGDGGGGTHSEIDGGDARSIMGRTGGEPPQSSNVPGLTRLRFALPNGKKGRRTIVASGDRSTPLRCSARSSLCTFTRTASRRGILDCRRIPRCAMCGGHHDSDDGAPSLKK